MTLPDSNPNCRPNTQAECARLREALRQVHHWIEDAIDSEGCTDDELLDREGMFWSRLISAREIAREALR